MVESLAGQLSKNATVHSAKSLHFGNDIILCFLVLLLCPDKGPRHSRILNKRQRHLRVSYNAAGVLSHLASDGPQAWRIECGDRQDVLDAMVRAIDNWNLNTERNINYRSFEPILQLARVRHTPECQHWAVWALANLTRVYREVRAKKPSLTQPGDQHLTLQHLKVTSQPPPMAGQAGCLQGQDRSAVTHPSSIHTRCCLVRLSCDNRCVRYTAPLANTDKYCSLVETEGGIEILEEVVGDDRPYKRIKELARQVLNHCQQYKEKGIVEMETPQPSYQLDG
ncbi:regulation of ligase activity protein [Homalodisca vitripennis]|nr:regulation of ligase activity protein [Homalodisca vitripennis]